MCIRISVFYRTWRATSCCSSVVLSPGVNWFCPSWTGRATPSSRPGPPPSRGGCGFCAPAIWAPPSAPAAVASTNNPVAAVAMPKPVCSVPSLGVCPPLSAIFPRIVHTPSCEEFSPRRSPNQQFFQVLGTGKGSFASVSPMPLVLGSVGKGSRACAHGDGMPLVDAATG